MNSVRAFLFRSSSFSAVRLLVIRALEWPTVRELIDFESQKLVFRSLYGDVPSYMKDIFVRVNNSTVRSLSNADVNLTQVALIKIGSGAEMLLVPRRQTLEQSWH